MPVSFLFDQEFNSQSATQTLQQQIQELQKQTAELKTQLEAVKKTEIQTNTALKFTKILQRGIKDDEVNKLQNNPDILGARKNKAKNEDED